MNVEGLPEWDIPQDVVRQSGLSAMVRVKDEAEYLPYSLRSIYSWVDQITIAVQGEQADQTAEIAEAWGELKKVKVLYYPFDSVPNGPGHDQQTRNSVYERAYFYNWCLAHTDRTHVMKFDGDMVALDDCGEKVREGLEKNDFVRFDGVEIVSTDPYRVSKSHPRANIETRVFPADRCRFETGLYCEALTGQQSRDEQYTIKEPVYLHFKWAKKTGAMKAWPENWQEMPHFKRISERAKPGPFYQGPKPSCL